MNKIFMRKIFMCQSQVIVLKLVVFPLLVVVSISYCIYCSWYVASKPWLTTQFYFTVAHLELLDGRDLKFSKIRANLYQG